MYIYKCMVTRAPQLLASPSTWQPSLNSFAQFGNNALLIASYGGRVEVVRMLLVEFNGSLDTENSVSVYFTVCITPLQQPL